MSSKSYISGHFEALDWRSLQFLDLPWGISCDLCAVIPERIFRLECYHSLCEGCYQGILRTNRRCPLDKQGFAESEVVISPVRTTPLGKLKVHCSNFSHGCNFVGPLERMKSHFLKDCEFHALACKKCCATVLRKNIVSHYMEEQCGAQNTFCPSEGVCVDRGVIGIGREVNASLSDIANQLHAMEDNLNSHTVAIDATKKCVMNCAAALRTLQEEQIVSSSTMSNDVSGMCTVTNASSSVEGQHGEQVASAADISNREPLATVVGLRKDVIGNAVSSGEGCKQCSDQVEVMSRRVQDLSSSADDKLNSIRDILRASTGYGTNVRFFHVQGIDELKKIPDAEKVTDTYSNVFAFCGHSVKLNVEFERCDDVIHIGVYMYICREPKDSLLKWPFLLPYVLTLVHPTDDKKNLKFCIWKPDLFEMYPGCLNRPVGSSHIGYGHSQLCKLEDALNGGFVHENSITVGVTIVQIRE